jgi:hypothetical protein
MSILWSRKQAAKGSASEGGVVEFAFMAQTSWAQFRKISMTEKKVICLY